MTIKVYGMAFSTCTQRVMTTLMEKGVEDWSLTTVDLMKGEQKGPDFLKLQPFGQVPVLEDGDVKVYESRAICRYVCEKFESQGTALLGKTPKERALVNQWLEVESQNYNPAVSTIVYQCVFAPVFGKTTDEKIVAEQLAKLEKVLDVYEAHLAQNKYLAGDFFSLADLSHLPYTNLLVNAAKKSDAFTSRKHLNAWWEDISSRSTWPKVLALQKQ